VEFHRLDDQPIQTDIRMCAGLFVKHAIFAEGSYIPQHSHATEHLSVIATGAVRAWADGELLGDFHAPAGVVIKAHVKHMFLALAPMTTILCVHRVNEDGEPAVHEKHQLVFAES
jgi:quercetin dioxygenase-like cupin family protein